MVASTQISDYVAAGTLASKPATPNVASGVSSLYYATDTGDTYMWDGSAWHKINSAAPTEAVVQNAVNSGSSISGVTLGVAPTNGNLLVALQFGAASSAGTGWTTEWSDSGGTTFTRVFLKIAGASESTTQSPPSAAFNGSLIIFEISGSSSGMASNTGGWTQDQSSTTHTVTPNAYKTTNIILGGNYSESTTDIPASYSSGITLGASSTTGHGVQAWYKTSPSVGSNSIVATYTPSINGRMACVVV